MSAIPDAFTALRVHSSKSDYRVGFESLGIDALTAGDVVIRVAYSGINYKDALAVTGKGRILKGTPRTPGIDLSGTVVASSSADYAVGDAVLVTGCNIGEALDGGYSEYARLPAEALVKLPAGLSLEEAMGIGTAGFTAALALQRMLENHQTPDMGSILINGPTGGVGSIAVQLFKRAGFHVTALTGKPDQADYLKRLGADAVLDRNSIEMGTKPLEAAQWGGAVDNLGGATLEWLTRTVKPWGNIASIGLAQSHTLSTTVMPFILRGVSLLGIHSVETPRARRLSLWQKLQGEWKPDLSQIVTRRIALAEVPAAAQEFVDGKVTGRTVVRVAA